MRKNVDKKIDKLSKKCVLCGIEDSDLLEFHRIKHGKDGGSYNINNTLLCCSNCHTKIHKNKISIEGWFHSTKGRVIFVKENGGERAIFD